MELKLKVFFLSFVLISKCISNNMAVVDELFSILASGENKDYIGEGVSQLQHALQCAQKAIDAKCDEEFILACLFHDIGHLVGDSSAMQMGIYGVAKHEVIGANFLKNKGFSTKVTDIMCAHVDAKRYLVFKDPKYYANLSDASKNTLLMQGGRMDEQEALAFEQSTYFNEKIMLRTFDELAKDKNGKVPNIDFLKNLCTKHLNIIK